MQKPDLTEPAHPKPNVCKPMTYVSQREYYYDIETQLDALWHDIDDGRFGPDAIAGSFYTYIKGIKTAIPKQ